MKTHSMLNYKIQNYHRWKALDSDCILYASPLETTAQLFEQLRMYSIGILCIMNIFVPEWEYILSTLPPGAGAK